MARKLLTINQTNLVQSIRSELKNRTGIAPTLTDILNAILNDFCLNSITENIQALYDAEKKETIIKQQKKDFMVFQGDVLSNGLRYKTIIAVKNKEELLTLLNITKDDFKLYWVRSSSQSYLNITLNEPGIFWGVLSHKRGRPSKNHFIKLSNVQFVK